MPGRTMKVGIIGCGNIGTKRAKAIAHKGEDQIAGIVELDRSRWNSLEKEFGCPISDEPRAITESKNIDAVIISTPPKNHISLVEECLKNGKDVLCEKPLGETVDEVKVTTNLADNLKRVLKCGFNLRHDRGLERARELCREGAIGKPYFLKTHYVNGCVLVNTNQVGSLLDLGSHLLDLALWFGLEPTDFHGFLQKTEYPLELDDNGFVTFRSGNVTAQIHFSLIRWRNHFQFEISGSEGALEVENLPKWGRQDLRLYRRVRPSGVPEITKEIFEGDLSWEREWNVFQGLVRQRDLSYNSQALKVMQLVALIRKTIPLRSLV